MSNGGSTDWGPDIIRPDGMELVVGRSASCGVQLLHMAVSRQHASLRMVEGKVLVRDLDSRAGVRVNGVQVTEQILQEGDRVEFGPVVYGQVGQHLRLLSRPEGVRLEARNLSVVRGGNELLWGVNLSVLPGKFVGILGPSGSGKTTLLKCLASFSPPATGSLHFDDLDVRTYVESYRTTLGYVPQDDVLYSPLTGRENLDFALRLRMPGDLRPEEREQIVAHALNKLQLASHGDKPVSVLSGGQRKRLNVAIELLSRPRILFLDEPTSGLDPAAETRLMRLLKGLAEKGTTVVCATHVVQNLDLFDEVVVVADRTAFYQGPPDELLSVFRVPNYPELYEALEDSSLPPVERAVPETAEPIPSAARSKILENVELVARNASSVAAAEPSRIPFSTQIAAQFLRGATVIWRDKALLTMLAVQPLLIGLLINLSQQVPDGLNPIFMFAVVASIWLGLNNTAREVIRDRPIYVRERLAGVTPEGYLAAKCLLYGMVGVVQVMMLVLLIRYANLIDPESHLKTDLAGYPLPYLMAVLWITYAAAMFLGLSISALAPSQESAVAALPLVVLPQMFLTQVGTGMSEQHHFLPLIELAERAGELPHSAWTWVLEFVSLLTYSRPALSLLDDARDFDLVTFVEWLYLLFMLLLTVTFLVAVFRGRERRWLEEG